MKPRLMLRIAGVLSIAAVSVHAIGQRGGQPRPFGFSAGRGEDELRIERRMLPLVSTSSIDAFHKFISTEPHLAGSHRDRVLAEWMRERWRESGLDDVQITEHEVLLPYPEEVTVEMTAPRAWRASMREDPVAGDPYSARRDLGIPFLAFSASGDATAEVIYAGSGNPADYDWLESHGVPVAGKIAIVRYSVPYSYRGFKALTAQKRGLAGLLIYSDPADDGAGKGAVYPNGPWGPESHIQRGAIVYDFLVPGDPLTPGWASVPGAKRIPKEQAASIPTIMSAPLSAKDAREILRELGGPDAPRAWQGGLGFRYRAGPGAARVHLRVRMDERIRPIWTVTGLLRGSEDPDTLVIVGNHRDAWIFGGVDPSSGSAALMELARVLGGLARQGVRPKRSLLFASWDAEEYTLTSSTEWGEQHADQLRDRAVAYINVDSAASGRHFSASAVPSLNRLIAEAATLVRDPALRVPVATAWKERHATQRGALPTGAGENLVNNRLGSGSDYTVFLNHLGIPSADITFDGPYGVYHSAYDNYLWVSRIGDPGFRYNAALVRLWAVMALRLANADVLPLDVAAYASRISSFAFETYPRRELPPDLRAAIDRLGRAARATDERIDEVASLGAADRDVLNRRLLLFERALLDDEGLPARPWYRHQIYAPRFTYAPEVLPALTEAVESGDAARIRAASSRLAAVLDRAARTLEGTSRGQR